MDKLPGPPLARIFELLSPSELFNCRSLCKAFKSEVDHRLATVTHLRLNEDFFEKHSFIPDVIYSSTICFNLTVPHQNLSSFFDLLQVNCPNLRVLSAASSVIPLEDLLKLSQNLVHFQIAYTGHPQTASPGQLKLLFPRLRSYSIGGTWHGPNSITQSSFDLSSLPLVSRMKDPSIAHSVQFVKISLENIPFLRFHLPALLVVEIKFIDRAPSSVLKCLEKSCNLQMIHLTFEDEVDGDEVCSLIASLQNLKTIFLETTSFSNSNSPELFKLSLPPNLVNLQVTRFSKVNFVQTEALTSLRSCSLIVFSSVSSFNFPNLLQLQLFISLLDLEPSVRILRSLGHSVKLERLDIYPSGTGFVPDFLLLSSSWLSRLTKLQSLKVWSYDPPIFNFRLSDHPNLATLSCQWHRTEIGENSTHIYFDQKYKCIFYRSDTSFTLTTLSGRKIKIDLVTGSKRTKMYFDYPLESTVTQATFIFPKTSSSFFMPNLLVCKIIFTEHPTEDVVIKLATSLLNSPKLKVVTLLTKNLQLTPNQLDILLPTLSKFRNLQRFHCYRC